VVGLDFDNAAANAVKQKSSADNFIRHFKDAAAEKASSQTFRHAPSWSQPKLPS
jgi:hypothetical protein